VVRRYTPEQIKQFGEDLTVWSNRARELSYRVYMHPFIDVATHELVNQGFRRRVQVLEHSIKGVFRALPAGAEDPTKSDRYDAACYLHCFVLNICGALDNLAQIWCAEAQVKNSDGDELKPLEIGLWPKNRTLRRSLKQNTSRVLTEKLEWLKYVSNYRHAVAHRTPLYVPPKVLNASQAEAYEDLERQLSAEVLYSEKIERLFDQQDQLGAFFPIMMHSFREQAQPVMIHPQIIEDYANVVEIAEHLFEDISGLSQASMASTAGKAI